MRKSRRAEPTREPAAERLRTGSRLVAQVVDGRGGSGAGSLAGQRCESRCLRKPMPPAPGPQLRKSAYDTDGAGSNAPILSSVIGAPRGGRFRTSALTQPFQARHQPLSVGPVTLLQLGQKTVFHLGRACPPRQLIALDLVPGLDVSQGRERVLQVGQKVVAIEPDVGFVRLSGRCPTAVRIS